MTAPLSPESKVELKQVIDDLLEDFIKETHETPFYHNTHQCHLSGSVDELRDIRRRVNSISDGGLYCYIKGRVEALDELRKMLINKGSDL